MARPTKEERAKKNKQALNDKNQSTDISNYEKSNDDIDILKLEQEIENDSKIQSGLSNNSSIQDIEFEEQRSDESQNIDSNDNNMMNQNNSYHEQIQMPEDEDDLSDLGANNDGDNVSDLSDIDDDIPDIDFDPLKERVKERDYTRTGSTKNEATESITNPDGTQTIIEEPIIPEPDIKEIPLDDESIDDNISGGVNKGKGTGNSGGSGNSGGGNKNTGSGDNNNNSSGNDNNSSSGDKKVNPNPKLDDLSPKQKREAAEKTADALILTYAQIVPIPFKKLSSFNMRKLQQMDMKDEIKLKNLIDDEGTTVKSYCEGVNEQVEQTFVVTKEMQNEIKEPLVDVLLENNLALTPAQRLGMAVAGQILQMGMVAVQNLQQNRGAMEYFKQFHKENLEQMKKMNKTEQEKSNNVNTNTNNNSNNTNASTNNNSTASNNSSNTNVNNDNKQTTTTSNVNSGKVKEESKFTPPPSDFINNQVSDDDDIPSDTKTEIETTTTVSETGSSSLDDFLSEENGGITVDEFLDEDDDNK